MTTQATHTPGPWSVTETFCNNACNRLVVRRKIWGGEVVADLGEAPDASRANARLIASAPDLLEALRTIANMKCDGDLWHGNEDGENVTNDETHDALVDALCIAREAIAQMEGAQ